MILKKEKKRGQPSPSPPPHQSESIGGKTQKSSFLSLTVTNSASTTPKDHSAGTINSMFSRSALPYQTTSPSTSKLNPSASSAAAAAPAPSGISISARNNYNNTNSSSSNNNNNNNGQQQQQQQQAASGSSSLLKAPGSSGLNSTSPSQSNHIYRNSSHQTTTTSTATTSTSQPKNSTASSQTLKHEKSPLAFISPSRLQSTAMISHSNPTRKTPQQQTSQMKHLLTSQNEHENQKKEGQKLHVKQITPATTTSPSTSPSSHPKHSLPIPGKKESKASSLIATPVSTGTTVPATTTTANQPSGIIISNSTPREKPTTISYNLSLPSQATSYQPQQQNQTSSQMYWTQKNYSQKHQQLPHPATLATTGTASYQSLQSPSTTQKHTDDAKLSLPPSLAIMGSQQHSNSTNLASIPSYTSHFSRPLDGSPSALQTIHLLDSQLQTSESSKNIIHGKRTQKTPQTITLDKQQQHIITGVIQTARTPSNSKQDSEITTRQLTPQTVLNISQQQYQQNQVNQLLRNEDESKMANEFNQQNQSPQQYIGESSAQLYSSYSFPSQQQLQQQYMLPYQAQQQQQQQLLQPQQQSPSLLQYANKENILIESDAATTQLCTRCMANYAKYVSSTVVKGMQILLCEKCSADFMSRPHSTTPTIISNIPAGFDSASQPQTTPFNNQPSSHSIENPKNESSFSFQQFNQFKPITNYSNQQLIPFEYMKTPQMETKESHQSPMSQHVTTSLTSQQQLLQQQQQQQQQSINQQYYSQPQQHQPHIKYQEQQVKREKISQFSSRLFQAKETFSNLLKQFTDLSEQSISSYHRNQQFIDSTASELNCIIENILASSKQQLVASFNQSLAKYKSRQFQIQQILNYLASTEKDLISNIDSIISDMDMTSLEDIIAEYSSMIHTYDSTRITELQPDTFLQLELKNKINTQLLNRFHLKIQEELTTVLETQLTTIRISDINSVPTSSISNVVQQGQMGEDNSQNKQRYQDPSNQPDLQQMLISHGGQQQPPLLPPPLNTLPSKSIYVSFENKDNFSQGMASSIASEYQLKNKSSNQIAATAAATSQQQPQQLMHLQLVNTSVPSSPDVIPRLSIGANNKLMSSSNQSEQPSSPSFMNTAATPLATQTSPDSQVFDFQYQNQTQSNNQKIIKGSVGGAIAGKTSGTDPNHPSFQLLFQQNQGDASKINKHNFVESNDAQSQQLLSQQSFKSVEILNLNGGITHSSIDGFKSGVKSPRNVGVGVGLAGESMNVGGDNLVGASVNRSNENPRMHMNVNNRNKYNEMINRIQLNQSQTEKLCTDVLLPGQKPSLLEDQNFSAHLQPVNSSRSKLVSQQ